MGHVMYQTYNKMAIPSNCNFMVVTSMWELEARKKEVRDRCCQQLIGIQGKMKWNYRRNIIFASPVLFISTIPACSVKTLRCQNGLVVTVNTISRLGDFSLHRENTFSLAPERTRGKGKAFLCSLPNCPWGNGQFESQDFLEFSFNQKTNKSN